MYIHIHIYMYIYIYIYNICIYTFVYICDGSVCVPGCLWQVTKRQRAFLTSSRRDSSEFVVF